MSKEIAQDLTSYLIETVSEASSKDQQLNIIAGNSKSFLGSPIQDDVASISTASHSGVIAYEPTELMLRARCGTPISEIEKILSVEGQMLGFEPPHFGNSATLGGTIASGLSGPVRPYSGSARDFVLGVILINGKGEQIGFGGQVMKNVAGYDVSRLMVGAMGTLGLIADVSLKVIPQPELEVTICFEIQPDLALSKLLAFSRSSLPVTATCYLDQKLYVRFAGNESSVRDAQQASGGEYVENSKLFWFDLREQQMDFFTGGDDIWRLSVAPATPIDTDSPYLIEWGGAQRWYQGLTREDAIQRAEQASGHATLFRTTSADLDRFHPLPLELNKIHVRLKHVFDPNRVFNPGRMYKNI